MRKRGLLLVAVMAMGILACGKKTPTTETSTTAAEKTEEVKTGQEGEDKESKADVAAKEYTSGEAK